MNSLDRLKERADQHEIALFNQKRRLTVYLVEFRKSRSISQKEMAEQTGLSQQSISKIESINGNPTLESLIKYCDYLGIDLSKKIANRQ